MLSHATHFERQLHEHDSRQATFPIPRCLHNIRQAVNCGKLSMVTGPRALWMSHRLRGQSIGVLAILPDNPTGICRRVKLGIDRLSADRLRELMHRFCFIYSSRHSGKVKLSAAEVFQELPRLGNRSYYPEFVSPDLTSREIEEFALFLKTEFIPVGRELKIVRYNYDCASGYYQN